MQYYNDIRELIDRVRRRWRTLRAFDAILRATLTAAAVIGVALLATRWSGGRPGLLVAVVPTALVAAAICAARALWPLRQVPGDVQVARFIEERTPTLDDRLVTAVDVAARQTPSPLPIAEPMLADAARRARAIEVDTIVPDRSLRRAGLKAAAATLVFLVVLFAGRDTARQTIDAASLAVWPSRVAIEVRPGNARIKAGSPLPIHARLVGNRAPVLAQLQIADGDAWRTSEMKPDGGSNGFGITLESLAASFKYRVVAGAAESPTYEIAVVHPPRVSRIDVDYAYPAGLNLPRRTEADSGDIYAPAGTDVQIHVFTDRPAATGQMALGAGRSIALTPVKANELVGAMKITADDSYRVGLADAAGMGTAGETEYFIRTLEDRPPEVHIIKPAADRSVTRLEEVDIEVHAEDDYGIDRLDLVYAVRGGPEKAVPLSIARGRPDVNGRHTLFLEELDVQPGDFVSYYARARDLTRGTRPNEARSDIFFLEVQPYEQEFALAQSQGGISGAGRNSLDDLVAAQKEVVVATFKIDRRAQSSKGAKSEQDVRSVSRAEAELKTRVEETSSTFRESTMRDPRRRQPGRGGRGGEQPQPPQPELRAGQTLPEEDDMSAAAEAMGKAVGSLDALKTADALPHEMDALNRLLKAQAAVKRREITRQQGGSGNDNRHSNVDISTLFDRELQKAQQTNYETKTNAEQKDNPNQSVLDKIKDLAHRQDELLKKQQELERNRGSMSEEELKRELEKLTREQSELRQRAEELARQTASQSPASQSAQQKSGQQGQSGQQSQSGQSGQQGQSGQRGQSGDQSGAQRSGRTGGDDATKRMRDASEEMRNATSDLRRQDAKDAAAAGNRALERLREAARELEGARPDDRRRAVGDLQMEARQVAEGERQVASELAKTPGGDAAKDALRRLAGDQERLAERARKLTDSLKRQAAAPGRGRGSDADKGDARAQAAAGDAARELERGKLADRMQQSADALRQATESRGQRGTTAPPDPSQQARSQVGAQQDLARALDKIADGLAAGASTQDAESRKLSDQLARAQSLRERLDATGRQMEGMRGQSGSGGGRDGRAGRNGGGADGGTSGRSAGSSGKAGEGTQGGGGSGADLAKLREEYARQLQETRDLVDQMRRDDPSFARGGGGGFTFEEATTLSVTAPGTEAFKQDFAKWDDLRRQATHALENAEAALSKKLQAKQSKDRLAAGTDDAAPPQYKQQVDSYFKAIASKRKQ